MKTETLISVTHRDEKDPLPIDFSAATFDRRLLEDELLTIGSELSCKTFLSRQTDAQQTNGQQNSFEKFECTLPRYKNNFGRSKRRERRLHLDNDHRWKEYNQSARHTPPRNLLLREQIVNSETTKENWMLKLLRNHKALIFGASLGGTVVRELLDPYVDERFSIAWKVVNEITKWFADHLLGA